MAFKMNRSTIKGTAFHKKQAAVAQTRTKADASLVQAGRFLGESMVPPGTIDFQIENPEINISDKKDKPVVDLGKGLKKVGKFFKNAAGNIVDAAGNVIGATVGVGGQILDELGNVVGNIEGSIENIQQTTKDAIEKKKADDLEKKKQKKADDLERRLKEAEEGGLSEEEELDLDLQERIKEDKDVQAGKKIREAAPDAVDQVNQMYEAFKAGEEKKIIAEADENLRMSETSRNQRLQDAAEKYNVKIEDLEAKEIGGRREFFPKQGAVGGPFAEESGGDAQAGGTQWDDELGRFKIPAAGFGDLLLDDILLNIPEDQQQNYIDAIEKAEEEALRGLQQPTLAEGVKPEDVNEEYLDLGMVKLNTDTNQYEYTDRYYRVQEQINQEQQEEPPTEEEVTEVTDVSQDSPKPKRSDYPNSSDYMRAIMNWHKEQEAKGETKQEAYPNTAFNYKKSSAMLKRDDRIFEFATPGGKIQQKMIKNGYIPKKLR